MIPGDECSNTNLCKQSSASTNYPIYQLYFHKFEESKCDKPLLAHDVYMRWIHQNSRFDNLTEKQIQLAAYTGYSLMYRTAAENETQTVVQ